MAQESLPKKVEEECKSQRWWMTQVDSRQGLSPSSCTCDLAAVVTAGSKLKSDAVSARRETRTKSGSLHCEVGVRNNWSQLERGSKFSLRV